MVTKNWDFYVLTQN